MIKVNGIDIEADGTVFAGKSVADYLATTNYDCKRIAVELNEDIVPKAKYAETLLKDGDSVEVVSFVGGG
ncbi:MAG: sulfur carrier protein ThiS [Fibrobacter sp.]|nr:sulfur carrier protein ThiS [Fibrobacter sp.]MCQ2109348.1 sulfur carrier protein ThiS [Fibrobacter sp.]